MFLWNKETQINVKTYLNTRLVIAAENGYIYIDRHGAHLFFQLILGRYEKGILILTRR